MENNKKEPVVIPLTQNLIAWVSPEDESLRDWGWIAKKAGGGKWPTYYAIYTYNVGGTHMETYLHNLVWERMMGADLPRGFLVDHINGDKLDNRRENLRLATRSQNEANKYKRRANTTSQYKGVTKINDGRKKCWRATMTVDTVQKQVGTFYTEEEAAIAYNQAAYEQWGEYAYLNEIDVAIPAEKKEHPHRKGRKSKYYKQKYKGRAPGRPRKDDT